MMILRRFLGGLVLLCLFLSVTGCVAPVSAPAGELPEVVRVVMDNNYPPYIFVGPDGDLQGILVDEWRLWEQKTGVKVEITALPWNEALDRMKAGEFDIIDTIFYTDERDKFFDFTDSYADINVRIFFNQNISGIASAADLKGFRVAVKAGDANAEYLMEQGVGDLVLYDSYEDIIEAASRKQENIFVIDEPPGMYFLYKYGISQQFRYSPPLDEGHFHRAVSDGNTTLLNLVEYGFSQITPAETQQIQNRWMGISQAGFFQPWLPYLVAGFIGAALLIVILFLLNRVLQIRVERRTLELEEALANLQASESQLRVSFEFLPIPISLADVNGEILMVNRKFTENYGYTREDLPTVANWFVLAYPDPVYRDQVSSIWADDLREAEANGEATVMREYKVTCKDGSVCDVEIMLHPVGNLWVTTFNNVTERNRVENALRESETIFSSFLEHSPIYVFFKDRNIRSLRLSKNYEQMLGMPIDQALGKTMDELFPSDLAKSMVADDLKILHEGRRIDIVEELDGHIYETTKFPIFVDGKPEILAGFTMDVTARKHSEAALLSSKEELRKKNELLHAVLESPKGIIIFSLDRQYCYTAFTVSHREIMRNIWGADIEIGANMLDFISDPADRQKARENFDRALCGDHFVLVEEYGDQALQRFYWEDHYSPIFSEDGSITGLTVFVINVSDRMEAEAALRASESRLRTVTENAPDTIMQVDRRGIILFINRPAPGLAVDDVLGTSVYKWVPESQHPVLDRTLNAVFSTGERQEYESFGPGAGGEMHPYSVRVMPVVIDGVADTAIYIATDISARVKAEEALRQSEQKYRTLFETMAQGVVYQDADGRIFNANPAAEHILGLTLAQMQGKTSIDPSWRAIHEDGTDFPGDVHPAMVALRTGKSVKNVVMGVHNNAEEDYRWININAVPQFRDGETRPYQVYATFEDITARKRAADELRMSENRFRILFEHAGMGVAQINSNSGRFIRLNQKYCRIIGYEAEELLQMTFMDISHPEDLSFDLEQMEQLKSGIISEFAMEKRLYCKDGSMVWVDLVVSPLWVAGETPEMHIAVIHNITDRKRAEYALRYSEAEVRKLNAELERRVAERTAQLEAANKELEAFAYSVSHDLRAPLRAIDGFSRILLDDFSGKLDQDGIAYLEKVRIANQNMSQLVDALLGLSRMSRAELHRSAVDLSEIALEVVETLKHIHPEHDVDFSTRGDLVAHGDARLLRIVLENLLGNAWKFTSHRAAARVEFGVEARQAEKVYFIRDNGAGFSMAYAGKLFGAFQRLHSANEFEGTGIGLATVQRIINRHGGRIWAEAEVNKGATFYFTLGETHTVI
jgi:PAS domain S-box-containing protein